MPTQHTNELAALLRKTQPSKRSPAAYILWRQHVEGIANLSARHNPHFDRIAFYKACDYNPD